MGAITTETTIQPLIYVACLAAYNNGILHGAWIDATADAWAMWDGINAMLTASPITGAEEWAIHDYEGFGGVRIEEYTGIERVAEIAGFLIEHGKLGAALIAHFSGNVEEAREAITERYLGRHANLVDYVQELTEETTAIPHNLLHYIDYRAMARDAEINGDLFTIDLAWDELHVFAGY